MDVDQSDWYGDGNSGGVSMISHPVAPKDDLGRLSISFEGGDLRAGQFHNFEVDLGIVKSVRDVYRIWLDGGLEVTIDRIEMQSALLHIEGRLRGTLIRQEVRSGARDESDTLTFELNFEHQRHLATR